MILRCLLVLSTKALSIELADIVARMNLNLNAWQSDGTVIVRGLAEEHLMNAYENLFLSEHTSTGGTINYFGWDSHDPHVGRKEILDLFCTGSIAECANQITNGAALQSVLTSWISPGQKWHQDVRVPFPDKDPRYFGAWIALDKIVIESGPFAIVPGSHLWDFDMKEFYKGTEDHYEERFFEEQIATRSANPVVCLLDRGDVVFWSGYTVHSALEQVSGSNALRKCAIGHYVKPEDKPVKKHGIGSYLSFSR